MAFGYHASEILMDYDTVMFVCHGGDIKMLTHGFVNDKEYYHDAYKG